MTEAGTVGEPDIQLRGPRKNAQSRPSVLVVDDEEEFLALTELFLSSDGYRVVKARAAGEALWYALHDPPDLVVLDLMLPGADGFQILRALKNEPETCKIPILACSAADLRDARGVLAAGFDGLFPKPVNWTSLRALLRRLFAP